MPASRVPWFPTAEAERSKHNRWHPERMERQDPIYASIGCAGSIYIGREHHDTEIRLYELLASEFGDLLAGWEQGDTFYLGLTHNLGPVEMPERPKQRLRPSEARIQNGLNTLIELVGAVRTMDAPLSDQDKEWKPSKQARKRLGVLVEYVLRGDARWRNEHAESEW